MPASFEPLISERFYKRADMWALVGYDPSLPYACRSCQHLKAIGRLKPETALEAARADMDARRGAAAPRTPAGLSAGDDDAGAAARRADRRHAAGARRADGRRRLRAADRLRQRRQPAARAHRPPRARSRAARRARRQPRAHRPAADGRERPARRRRRRCSASLLGAAPVPRARPAGAVDDVAAVERAGWTGARWRSRWRSRSRRPSCSA